MNHKSIIWALALSLLLLFTVIPQAIANEENGVSTSDIITMVEEIEGEGQFTNESAVRALTIHLSAVGHYEQQGETDKVVKHMNSFKLLLDHQLDTELITEDAHNTLMSNTDALIKKWTDESKNVMLANNGNAMYGVHVSSDNNAIEYHAAEELVDYLTQITGALFELSVGTNPPNGPTILVGRNDLTESLIPELTDDTLGEDGFVIRKTRQYIVIAGSHPRGTMYGVNYFLDYYVGVKWFSPGYTFVPSQSKLQLQVDNDVQVPRFEYREMYVNDGNDEHYRAHNLLNGKYRDRHWRVPQSEPWLDSWSDFWPYGVHNFHEIVPQTEYHYGNQLLAMNENVRRIASENLIDIINQRINEGEDASYNFSQMDTSWTPDPDSQAFADQHGGTLAAPIFDMVGDVAERVRGEIPDARIGTLAYQYTLQAPTGMTVPDNVVITFAPIRKDHGRAINSPQNEFFGENARRWAELSDNIIVWDYLTDYLGGGFIMPYPNLYAMSETIQYLAQFPAYKGYFGQAAQNNNTPASTGFTDLLTWLGARLLWNPDQDYHQLIEEFVEGYYGDAAPYISEYIELLHQSFEQSDSTLEGISTPISSSYLSFDLIHRADELFAQAAAAVANDPVFLEHVQKTRIEIDYVILLRGGEYIREAAAQNIDWDFDYDNRFERFKTYTADIVEYKIRGTMESLLKQFPIDYVIGEGFATAVKTTASKEDILQTLDFSQGPWTEAKPFNNFSIMGTYIAPSEETKVYLLWDDENLYVGYENFDDDMSGMVVSDEAPDGWWSSGADDSVETFVTGNPEEAYLGFFSNPKAVKFARYQHSLGPEVEWDVSANIGNDRWNTVQVIPFAEIGVDPTDTETIQALFFRNYHGRDEFIGWQGGAPWRQDSFRPVHLVE